MSVATQSVGSSRGGPGARNLPLWVRALLLFAGYFLAARLGDALSVQHAFSTFWPPAGVLLGALVLSEPSEWPVLLVTAAAAGATSDVLVHRSVLELVGFAVTDATEGLLAAFAVRRLAGPNGRLDSVSEVLRFFSATLIGALAGATGGTILISTVFGVENVAETWGIWYTGDVLGMLVVAPLVFLGFDMATRMRTRRERGARIPTARIVAGLLAGAVLGAAGWLAFTPTDHRWVFVLVGAVLIVGFLLGQEAAIVAVNAVAVSGVAALVVALPSGTVSAGAAAMHVLETQAFLAVTAVSVLILTAAMRQLGRSSADAQVIAAKYRTLFEEAPAGIAVTDESGEVVEANRKAQELLACGLEGPREGVEAGAARLVRLDGSPMPLEELASARALAQGATVGGVVAGLEIGERTTWIEMTSSGVDAPGYGVAVVYFDVTGMVEEHAALRLSEERYEQLFEGVLEGFAYCRAVWNGNGQVADWVHLRANRAYGAILGLGDVTGEAASHVFPGIRESDPELFEMISRVTRSGTPERRETDVAATGSSLRISVTKAEPDHFVLAFEDISERRRAEASVARYQAHLEQMVAQRTEQLERVNEELVAASRAKDEFLANMSHELRTPLNSIIGFSGVLAGGMTGPLTEEQTTQVEVIGSSGRHLLGVIDSLLDLAKIGSGRMEPDIAEFPLADLVEDVIGIARPLVEAKDLELAIEVPEDAGVMRSDRARLRQVLINLVGNAVKFTGSGRVCLSVERDGDDVAFAVSDTGCGIAEEDLEHVFEEYFQVRHDDVPKPSGTGLGLAVSRRLVEMLGGTLEATSELGAGSCFTARVPSTAL